MCPQQCVLVYQGLYTQQCCHLLRSNVGIVWPELANPGPALLEYVALRCRYRLAGTSHLAGKAAFTRQTKAAFTRQTKATFTRQTKAAFKRQTKAAFTRQTKAAFQGKLKRPLHGKKIVKPVPNSYKLTIDLFFEFLIQERQILFFSFMVNYCNQELRF